MEFTNGVGLFERAALPCFLLVRCGPCSEGLTQTLGSIGIEATSVDILDDVLPALDRLEPDAVLVGHPYGAGAELVALLAPAVAAAGSVLVALMSQTEGDAAVRLLEAGADEVVEPPHTASVVALRCRVARARASGIRRKTNDEALRLDPETREVRLQSGRLNLSGREFDLLEYLTNADGTAVPRQELMAKIWGRSGGSESVLDATVHRLRKRLDALGLPEDTIETVWGVGYRFDTNRIQSEAETAA